MARPSMHAAKSTSLRPRHRAATAVRFQRDAGAGPQPKRAPDTGSWRASGSRIGRTRMCRRRAKSRAQAQQMDGLMDATACGGLPPAPASSVHYWWSRRQKESRAHETTQRAVRRTPPGLAASAYPPAGRQATCACFCYQAGRLLRRSPGAGRGSAAARMRACTATAARVRHMPTSTCMRARGRAGPAVRARQPVRVACIRRRGGGSIHARSWYVPWAGRGPDHQPIMQAPGENSFAFNLLARVGCWLASM